VSLRDQVQTELTAAMRSGDVLRRDVLRMVASAAYNVEKRQQQPLTDEEFLAVVTREVKTRRESVEAFRGGGREDLATKEEAEIAVLEGFLPEQLTDEELEQLVAQALAETGATSARDMGKVMGWLTPRTRGRADGKRVSGLVAQRLARADLGGHDRGDHKDR
jgi:uncharacterized protein YqeY